MSDTYRYRNSWIYLRPGHSGWWLWTVEFPEGTPEPESLPDNRAASKSNAHAAALQFIDATLGAAP